MKKYTTSLLILILLIPSVARASLIDNVEGKILLQVEDVGQAWYVVPDTRERAFLGRPADAFRIMRELGLGISEKDFNTWDNIAPQRLAGKIVLRVEANGEAYYIDTDSREMHYLGRPADAFSVMRSEGLGITNDDLNAVPVFQEYKEQVEENTSAIDELSDNFIEEEIQVDNEINELKEIIDAQNQKIEEQNNAIEQIISESEPSDNVAESEEYLYLTVTTYQKGDLNINEEYGHTGIVSFDGEIKSSTQNNTLILESFVLSCGENERDMISEGNIEDIRITTGGGYFSATEIKAQQDGTCEVVFDNLGIVFNDSISLETHVSFKEELDNILGSFSFMIDKEKINLWAKKTDNGEYIKDIRFVDAETKTRTITYEPSLSLSVVNTTSDDEINIGDVLKITWDASNVQYCSSNDNHALEGWGGEIDSSGERLVQVIHAAFGARIKITCETFFSPVEVEEILRLDYAVEASRDMQANASPPYVNYDVLSYQEDLKFKTILLTLQNFKDSGLTVELLNNDNEVLATTTTALYRGGIEHYREALFDFGETGLSLDYSSFKFRINGEYEKYYESDDIELFMDTQLGETTIIGENFDGAFMFNS